MKVPSKENTIEYIKHAIDLESSIVAQKQIIDDYKTISNEKKPVLDLQPLPERKYVGKNSDNEILWFLGISFIVLGMGFLVSGFFAVRLWRFRGCSWYCHRCARDHNDLGTCFRKSREIFFARKIR